MKRTTCLIPLFLFLLFLTSCGKDYLNEFEKDLSSETVELPESTVTTTDPPASNQPSSAPATTPTTAPSPPTGEEHEKKSPEEEALPMMNVPTFGYYTLPENSLPLFSRSCLIVANPESCSSEKLGEWLNAQLRDQENELQKGEYSIQYVFFELDEKGKIFNIQHAGSDGNTLCWTCLEMAMATVKKMPDWSPAVKDGIPLNTSIKLPIRFESI